MSELPEPFTPSDCDLRGLQFMPIYGDRLFSSATWIAAKPEAKVAALRLWWHSYAKEAPAASLPDDDALLAEYAGYGVAVSQWRKIKAAALRGWVKCSDGRLYHRVVADLALEAWEGRKENRRDSERKRKEREERSRLFAELSEHNVTPPWNLPTGKLREMHQKTVTGGVTSHVTGGVTGHRETAVTGGVTVTAGEGEGQGHISSSLRSDDNPPASQAPTGARSEARGTRLPEGWTLTPELTAYAAQHGYTEREARFIAHRFTNHWRAATGVKAIKRDWPKTFQNWVTNENRRQIREGAAAWNDSGGTSGANWSVRIDLWRKRPQDWPDRWGPKPDEPGYQGPALDLFASAEAHP